MKSKSKMARYGAVCHSAEANSPLSGRHPVRMDGFQTKLLGLILVRRSIGRSRALAQAHIRHSTKWRQGALSRAILLHHLTPFEAHGQPWDWRFAIPMNVIRTQW